MKLPRGMTRGPDWFLIGLAGAAGLAWLAPEPGARGGSLHAELLETLGVALIFFLHGVLLPFSTLQAGSLRWPLHLFIQAATFLLFPLLGLAGLALAGDALPSGLRLGFLFLCAVPSTVSSSVVLTAVARGHVPVAVFNATLSSLLGVFLTPLWMGLALEQGGAVPLGTAVAGLLRWLLAPLLLGQALRPWLGALAASQRTRLARVERLIILLLVYTSLCDSIIAGTWAALGAAELAVTLLGVGLLLGCGLLLVDLLCRAAGFAQPERVAAVFCGSQKSLAAGVPLAALLFAGHPALGVVLLPLMLYHPLQLALGSLLAARWERRTHAA